ncbi:MAG: hypothetical protein U0166_13170 [Acidobacteriota bacterium]
MRPLPLLALATLVVAPALSSPVIVVPGTYAPGETDVRSGELWLGLYDADSGRHELRYARLHVERCPDATVVEVEGAVQPLLLVKSAPELKAGSVLTFDGDAASGDALRVLFSGDLDWDGRSDAVLAVDHERVTIVALVLSTRPGAAPEVVTSVPVARRDGYLTTKAVLGPIPVGAPIGSR